MNLSPRTIIKIKMAWLVADMIDYAIIVGLGLLVAKILS